MGNVLKAIETHLECTLQGAEDERTTSDMLQTAYRGMSELKFGDGDWKCVVVYSRDGNHEVLRAPRLPHSSPVFCITWE